MKIIILAAVAAAISAPASLAAQADDNTIIVQTAPSVDQWSSEIGSRLSRNLDEMPFTREGVALVRFQCSEEGRPTSIELFQPSESSALDQAAMRAVARLKGMHPLPGGIGKDQIYEAAIIVAASRLDLRRQVKQWQLARASEERDPRVFAFLVASSPGRGRP